MKREKLFPLIFGAAILFFAGVLLGGALSRPGRSYSSPDDAQPSGQSFDVPVQTVTGVTSEMLSAGYWKNDEDTLLFSPEEIASFNENNPAFVLYNSIEENKEKKLFLYDLPSELQCDIVLSLLDREFLDGMRSGEKTVYVNGSVPGEDYWTALEANCGFEDVPSTVTPVYAVCLRRTVAQRLPSDDFASEDPGETYCSDFVSAEIMPCAGVAVLHESADGEWRYVLTGSFCGWVRSDVLALCKDRSEWIAAIRPEKYLIVTGSELILDDTAVPTVHAGEILPMGTKLRLAEQTPAEVNGRSALGCYCVELPCAGSDGSLCWETALIGVTQDVHVGYLPMTSNTVVEQAFK
ncbi:MAG: SH3 domain-containing protein, partial [Firmicutes bacterium]|nr:SH3 domain-containing protein [Bacillota bacterium]